MSQLGIHATYPKMMSVRGYHYGSLVIASMGNSVNKKKKLNFVSEYSENSLFTYIWFWVISCYNINVRMLGSFQMNAKTAEFTV